VKARPSLCLRFSKRKFVNPLQRRRCSHEDLDNRRSAVHGRNPRDHPRFTASRRSVVWNYGSIRHRQSFTGVIVEQPGGLINARVMRSPPAILQQRRDITEGLDRPGWRTAVRVTTVMQAVAVFSFELIDTSREGPVRGARADKQEQLTRDHQTTAERPCILSGNFG
jgi:hypothetical protein